MARKKTEPIQFDVPIGARDEIKAYAGQHGYSGIAEYLRTLIEADMKAHNVPISLDVEWGGDRRPKQSEDEQ